MMWFIIAVLICACTWNASFAEYSLLELKRAKSRQTPIREQLRQAEEQVKKQPQRELTKEAAHGDR